MSIAADPAPGGPGAGGAGPDPAEPAGAGSSDAPARGPAPGTAPTRAAGKAPTADPVASVAMTYLHHTPGAGGLDPVLGPRTRLGDPPDYPARALPAGAAQRARRAAARVRVLRAAGALLACAALATALVVGVSANHRHAAPGPGPTVTRGPNPPPNPTRPEPPKGLVGLGSSAWVDRQGWCVGDVTAPGGVGIIDSCRFMPPTGQFDIAVLNPGRGAPEGYQLVVVVVLGRFAENDHVFGHISDDGVGNDLALVRITGVPNIAFLWAFTTGGPVIAEVTGADGTRYAQCADCGAPSR
ncbi:hypothetical protein [Yinghuangia seranimata]|uniref:hypothetical protein n=1 Tax=Yinghuangia seranimata TaxID=408067 RepID=UPI00248B53F0|nr:hypothetical protein [Yinghuangia seranimata]MDI2128826.1 hypothetical protein [Yinghuangia seranimata]